MITETSMKAQAPLTTTNARETVEAIALRSERDRTDLLSRSLSCSHLGGELKATVSDETLFLELALRGYDLSRLRDEEPTAEIIKVG